MTPRREADDTVNLVLGLVGSALLLIGVFCPLVSMPIMGSISYVHNGRGDGIFVAALAGVSLVLVLCRVWVGLWFTSLGSLGMLGFTFTMLQTRISEMEQEFKGNAFAGLITNSISLGWGFAVIIVGAALLIASAAIAPRPR